MNNPNIQILTKETLSDYWYTLDKYTIDYQTKKGHSETHTREVYDRGNGACVLLYNKVKQTVVLTKQFRLPTYVNGNETGLMIEVCAGVLDGDSPEKCVIRETKEETGYKITNPKKVFESYMSPGAVTELLHFFTAEYSEEMKVDEGGGLDEEHEHIEVLEMPFEQAYNMIKTGDINDSKTIMLLQYAKIHILI